jgi:hypothetical protein
MSFTIRPIELKKLNQLLKEGGSTNIWNPTKAGEKIIGQIKQFREIKKSGKVKKPSRLIILETAEGEKGVWEKTVIASRFLELGVKVGNVIGIEYKGKVKNYHNYSVAKL